MDLLSKFESIYEYMAEKFDYKDPKKIHFYQTSGTAARGLIQNKGYYQLARRPNLHP